jgi:phenylacetate-CoA ligase
MSHLELSVIAPCFNEEANISELARRVTAVFSGALAKSELILVDDGSRDGTRAAIEDATRAYPDRVRAVFHPANLGIAAAWRSGLAAARAPLIALIDADLQYRPEDLSRLHQERRDHHVDIVQGWRSERGRARDARYLLSRGFNFLLNAAFSMNLCDNKSGFVLCAREVLDDLLRYQGNYRYWQCFIMVAAHAKGYTYRQIETSFDPRRGGKSFIDGRALAVSARALLDLGRALFEYRLLIGGWSQ